MSEPLAVVLEANPRRFRPYPEYKDSGVEWLGEIPMHWEAQRLKRLAAEPIRNGVGEPGEHDNPNWPRYIRITDIKGPRSLRADTFRSLPPEVAAAAQVARGDLLLAAVGATFGKSYLHTEDTGPACYAGYLVKFSPRPICESAYIAYWTESLAYWDQIRSSVIQATIQNFSAARYRELIAPVPPLTEQRAIVGFLDRETAKIDALLAKKERVIELLQEKRTSLITQAVTKGLDPGVPKKDSGLEWLGEIPARWDVKRLKYLVPDLTVGIVVTPAKYYVDNGIPCLRSLNISTGEIDMDNLVFISKEANEYHRKSKIFKGDVVVVRTGQAGTAAIVPEKLSGANCIDLLIVRRSDNIRSKMVYYYLNSRAAISQAGVRSVGAIQGHYNTSTLAELFVPVIPVDEQDSIVRYLDDQTAAADKLIETIREGIDRLTEFRTALISSAVTGKIDVRKGAA